MSERVTKIHQVGERLPWAEDIVLAGINLDRKEIIIRRYDEEVTLSIPGSGDARLIQHKGDLALEVRY